MVHPSLSKRWKTKYNGPKSLKIVSISIQKGFENIVCLDLHAYGVWKSYHFIQKFETTICLNVLLNFNKCVSTKNMYENQVLKCFIISKLLYAWYITRTLGLAMANSTNFFAINITFFNQGNLVMSCTTRSPYNVQKFNCFDIYPIALWLTPQLFCHIEGIITWSVDV